MAQTGPPEELQSLARGLAVVDVLARADEPLTLAQVAQGAGLNRAVARRVLLTLVEVGYVRSRGREFTLRPRVLELGQAYRESLRLPALALPHMRELVHATGQSCSLAVLDGADIVYVQRVAGTRIVDAVIHVGTRLPAHATAMGRVLLAALDPPALDALLTGEHLGGLTERTITDTERLRAALGRVRTDGYARVDGEFEPALTSVAAPVRDVTDRVVAAVNLPLSTYALVDGALPDGSLDRLLATAGQITAAAVAAGVEVA